MVTLEDVAKLAGVSAMTVSRVLNNPDVVKKATRDKVNEVIAQSGYRPNLLAKSLVSGTSKTIGIISSNLYNQAYTDIIVAIERIAYTRGFGIINTNVNTSDEAIHALDRMIASRVDGIILLPLEMKMAALTDYREAVAEGDIFIEYFKKMCADQQIKTVTVSQKIGNLPDVGFDFACQCELSLDYLLNRGYEDIAMLNSHIPAGLWKCKEDKYIEIMERHGLGAYVLVERDAAVIHKAKQATEQLLDRHVPQAIYCANDVLAAGALQAIHERKLSVPDDIAVIGNDNMYICNYVYPELTTVALGSEIAGEQAIKKLLSLLEGQSVESETVAPYLVERASVAEIRKVK